MKPTHPTLKSILLRCAIALLAGASVTLALAPFTLWPVAAISPAVLWLLWHFSERSLTPLLGWFYGLGLFGAGASWVYVSIHQFGNASATLAASLTLLFCGLLALLFVVMAFVYRRLLWNRPLSLTHALAFTGLWVLNEWLRTWLLTGFPWLFIGYGLIDTPMASIAPVTGVLGLSFVLCGLGCLWALALFRRTVLHLSAAVGASIGIAVISTSLASIDWTTPSGEIRTVAIVQPNTSQAIKWNPRYYEAILSQLDELTLQAFPGDIVIWPEAAVPALYHRALQDIDPMVQRIEQNDQALISGVPFANRATERYHNSISVFAGGEGLYHKQRLVPFGEYVPLDFALRGLIDFFDLPMSNFSSGDSYQAPLWAQEQIIAPSICYEIVYPDLVARGARGTDWLLTISNDAWFGDSIGPIQHLQMAQMRAAETQRYLVRGTSNGISAIVSPQGKIVTRSDQFVPALIRGEVHARSGSTPFMQAGSTPVLVLSLIVLLYGRQRPLQDPALKGKN